MARCAQEDGSEASDPQTLAAGRANSQSRLAGRMAMKPHIKLHRVNSNGQIVWECGRIGTVTFYSNKSPSESYMAWYLEKLQSM